MAARAGARLSSACAVVAVASALLAAAPSVALADDSLPETAGGVAHTWTNYTNAGGQEGPSIPAYATVMIACAVHGMAVANGNTWWYRVASSPWNGNFYVSADAFYNNGATSGSLVGTPYVDSAVSQCGAPAGGAGQPPQPAADPHVTLAQGAQTTGAYRYAVTVSGFAPNTTVSVVCFDSASPAGFYSFGLNTDGAGQATTGTQCYSGDSGEHWVVANGTYESNHVSWNAPAQAQAPVQAPAQAPVTAPAQAPTPAPAPATTAPAAAACTAPTGLAIPDSGSVAYALYDHYMWGGGSAVVIDWSYFAKSASFTGFAKSLPVDGKPHIYRDGLNTDMFYALGSFSVSRTSTNCYQISDHYDFTPSTDLLKIPDTLFTLPEWAYQLSGSREFDVRGGGTL